MFVVTLPSSAAKDPSAFAEKAAAAGADILEIRGDRTPDIAAFQSPLPLLVSPRGSSIDFVSHLDSAYVDYEHGEISPSKQSEIPFILSYHNYKETPDVEYLLKVVQEMCSHTPWIIKIATYISRYEDYFTLREVRTFLNKKSIQSTIFGMGPKSHLSRILSPLENVLTYACLSESDAAAPGQLTLEAYTRMKHLKQPRIVGLLGGEQISGSFSPLIHAVCAEKTQTDLVYARLPTVDLTQTFPVLQEIGVTGFSVTAPWKREILTFATVLDPVVERLQSANTLVRSGDEFVAYNTDIVGFVEGYPFLNNAENVAILGSGGVVPAIIEALHTLNPTMKITVYARRADAVKKLFLDVTQVLPLEELSASQATVFICAISDDITFSLPSADRSSLTADRFVAIDLRYGKQTKFLTEAQAKGYTTHDGLPMLIAQGLAQFTLFTGKTLVPSDRTAIASMIRTDPAPDAVS